MYSQGSCVSHGGFLCEEDRPETQGWMWPWCGCIKPSQMLGKSMPGGEWTMQPAQWHHPQPAKNNEKVPTDFRSQIYVFIVFLESVPLQLVCIFRCEDRPKDWVRLRKGTDPDVLHKVQTKILILTYLMLTMVVWSEFKLPANLSVSLTQCMWYLLFQSFSVKICSKSHFSVIQQ